MFCKAKKSILKVHVDKKKTCLVQENIGKSKLSKTALLNVKIT